MAYSEIHFVCLDCGTEVVIKLGKFVKRPCKLDSPSVTTDCPVCGVQKMLKIFSEEHERDHYSVKYHSEKLHEEIQSIIKENEDRYQKLLAELHPVQGEEKGVDA